MDPTTTNIQEMITLAALIRTNARQILATWRDEVRRLPSAEHLDVPTLNDHIPALLEELAQAFEEMSEETIAENLTTGTPKGHGTQRVLDGFDIVEVVAEYNILRDCIHDVADANGLTLQGTPFHILNRVLDGAIGLAVNTYTKQQALEVQRRREEYLAFVAHDLRTPLSAIALASQALELSFSPGTRDADSTRMINVLQRNVRQLESLVHKILEENTNMQPDVGITLERRHFELWPLVASVIHDVKPIAGNANTRLVNEVPDDVAVFADAGLLRRILQNLIANAITYAPVGVVSIGARIDRRGSAECWVSDTGSGIPADLLEKVFEPGTGDPVRPESSGLGLAIVKTFVEAHGGTVHAESEPGQGCTIRFTLPTKN